MSQNFAFDNFIAVLAFSLTRNKHATTKPIRMSAKIGNYIFILIVSNSPPI